MRVIIVNLYVVAQLACVRLVNDDFMLLSGSSSVEYRDFEMNFDKNKVLLKTFWYVLLLFAAIKFKNTLIDPRILGICFLCILFMICLCLFILQIWVGCGPFSLKELAYQLAQMVTRTHSSLCKSGQILLVYLKMALMKVFG